MNSPGPNPRPFADSVLAYAQAGWPAILPVPIEKSPPPVGFTGADGRDTDPVQLAAWFGSHGDWSVALRMPDGVIGIDVDAYTKHGVDKHGERSLAAALEVWGPLPPTWSSTARGAGPSRISFYRVPAGRYVTKLPGGDVEIIQRHHRYAVVWPSPHPEAGDIYRWYDPAGHAVDAPPKPTELPELPAPWVNGLREGATDAGPAAAGAEEGQVLLEALRGDDRPACPEIVNAVMTALDQLTRVDAGSRHDTAVGRVHNLVQLAAAGHPGFGRAVPDMAALWDGLTAGEDRGEEFERMLLTSARKAVTTVGPRQVANDPCAIVGELPIGIPAAGGPPPGDDRKDHEPPDPIEAPRELHPLEVIGSAPFTPREQLDQLLADAVLERMYPVLRYAYDERGWLKRQRTNWEHGAELAEWAITQVAETMPRGNPDADKGTLERDLAERRKRLMTSGGASGVAKMMRARVAGGAHPCALRAADLDSEPWLLWAGGVPWDLTACAGELVVANIDPATPHLRSAGVAPAAAPTPLWDAFTAAVWPDPELRAWSLRVLAIAVTGYSDKALPILIGERDRGKTQVVALLMSVLGSYAHAADPRLLNGLDNAHASIIYALKGRRLSFIDEGPREGRLGQERLKQLTGGGDLTGNQMNRNPITFTPTHTLVLTANDEPTLTDPAIRSRTRLIPCEGDPTAVRAARSAIGHTTSRRWRREAPGVLAAMMREAAAWLAEPDSALTAAAPEVYRDRAEQIALAQDPVRNWVTDETEPYEPGERSRTLYEAFVGWCRNGSIHPGRIVTETRWALELAKLGYPAEKRRAGAYRPLRLRPRAGWAGGGFTLPGDGFVAGSTSTHHTTINPPQAADSLTQPTAETISVVGVTGSHTSYAHAPAHDARATHAREPRPETAPHPSTPTTHSARITATLTAEPPAPPDDTGDLFSTVTPLLDADGGPAPQSDLAPATALALEYHAARQEQDRRFESMRGHFAEVGQSRGSVTDTKSEEYQRYFGEGEFEGSTHAIEQRLTWARFLEQRRPGREHEKALNAAYDAGFKLGRRHAFQPGVGDPDADYERAAHKHDEQIFGDGYRDGIVSVDTEIAAAAGPPVTLPAVVTRDGQVRPVTLAGIAELSAAFGLDQELTVDVETSGFPIGHADYALRTVQAGNDQAALVFDADNPDQLAAAGTLIRSAAVLHAHSATADLVPLATAGAIDLEASWARMHDTVIPALLADPASTGSDADGLKALAGDVLPDATSPAADEARAALFKAGKWLTDTKPTTPVERSGWAQVDRACTTMVRYAASDVLDAAALARRLPPVPPGLLERERTAQRMTTRVAHRGLALDGEHVAQQAAKHQPLLAEAAERIRAFGVENPGSDQQVAARLIELGAPLPRTPTGRPSVAKGGLEPLRHLDGDVGELVRARLDYQHHETVLSTFLEPYRQLVQRGDGRARPTIYTLGAETGRMSCVRPNLQQVPREGGMRACITADPGTLLVSADFAGVELRVAAALSGDRNLHAMIAQGVDVHWEIARLAFGPDATKADRYAVKRGVFGRIYGGGTAAIARGVGVSEIVAAAIIAALDTMLPELTAWSQAVRSAVKSGQTQFPSYAGRIIHLPPRFPHKAPNYCIQGTARELLVDALIRLEQTRWRDATLLPVHDEVLMVVPEHEAADATAALVAAMETELNGIAIKAEASEPSFSWKDAS